MLLTNWTMAVDRHDDGSADLYIHHGGTAMRLQLESDEAAAVGNMLLGRPVVPDGPGGKIDEPSGDNRTDGYGNPSDSAPPLAEK